MVLFGSRIRVTFMLTIGSAFLQSFRGLAGVPGFTPVHRTGRSPQLEKAPLWTLPGMAGPMPKLTSSGVDLTIP